MSLLEQDLEAAEDKSDFSSKRVDELEAENEELKREVANLKRDNEKLEGKILS